MHHGRTRFHTYIHHFPGRDRFLHTIEIKHDSNSRTVIYIASLKFIKGKELIRKMKLNMDLVFPVKIKKLDWHLRGNRSRF